MSIELTMKRGEEAVAATIDVRDDVTLTEAYDAAAAGLHPMTVRAGAYLGRVLDNLTITGEVRAPQQAPAPVIDWDSAPEGFPVWIEDVVPFGDSASCWAKDAGSHYLGVNGSKWAKPGDAIFCAHHRMKVIKGEPSLSAALVEKLRSSEACPPPAAFAVVARAKENVRASCESTSVVLMNPSPVDFQASIKCFDPAFPVAVDWSTAPEGATHRIDPPGQWYMIDFEADTAHYFGKLSKKWIDVGPASAFRDEGLIGLMVARPVPVVREKWSLHGKDGTWDYDTLAELVIDNYGHDSCGDGHPASYRPGLYEGDTIYRASPCFDDPVDFLPDASDVVDHMADRASDSDAGEWADRYPDLSADAKEALGKALEPLKAWARMHCQPDFFTVKDITPYVLTVEDVRVAKAQERAQ